MQKKVKELGITYPVLTDPEGENWKRWGQRWWPTVYVIDRQGRARYRWAGELEWKGAGGEAITTRQIQDLLREKP